jgi:hypothetical protein
MERLFLPCTRFRDTLERQGRLGPRELLQDLNLDVSTEKLLSAERAFTYADLYAMLGGNGDTVAWLTPHAIVVRGHGRGMFCWRQLDELCRFIFNVDGKDITALTRSPEHLLEICDLVLGLLAASVVHSLILGTESLLDRALINAPTLAYLMKQCQSLKALRLKGIALDKDHLSVLGDLSRPDLEITLEGCRIEGAAATVLADVLGGNQGPTELDFCCMDYFVIANGLRGNSRLKSLTQRFSYLEDDNREVLAIVGALKENKGLVELGFHYGFSVSDETWGAVCDSLETHPTFQVLSFQSRGMYANAEPPVLPAVRKSRMQALVDMLKGSMSIHTLYLDSYIYSEHRLFRRSVRRLRKSVRHHLETNRLRLRVRAIKKTRPIAYRAKVLGRALHAVRSDVNSLWMLISGNPEVAFPSMTATMTAAATNLPTAAIASATSNSTAAVFTVAASRAASTTGASGTANVATSTACQKRKARP